MIKCLIRTQSTPFNIHSVLINNSGSNDVIGAMPFAQLNSLNSKFQSGFDWSEGINHLIHRSQSIS